MRSYVFEAYVRAKSTTTAATVARSKRSAPSVTNRVTGTVVLGSTGPGSRGPRQPRPRRPIAAGWTAEDPTAARSAQRLRYEVRLLRFWVPGRARAGNPSLGALPWRVD